MTNAHSKFSTIGEIIMVDPTADSPRDIDVSKAYQAGFLEALRLAMKLIHDNCIEGGAYELIESLAHEAAKE
jgi:hypothetical protein